MAAIDDLQWAVGWVRYLVYTRFFPTHILSFVAVFFSFFLFSLFSSAVYHDIPLAFSLFSARGFFFCSFGIVMVITDLNWSSPHIPLLLLSRLFSRLIFLPSGCLSWRRGCSLLFCVSEMNSILVVFFFVMGRGGKGEGRRGGFRWLSWFFSLFLFFLFFSGSLIMFCTNIIYSLLLTHCPCCCRLTYTSS